MDTKTSHWIEFCLVVVLATLIAGQSLAEMADKQLLTDNWPASLSGFSMPELAVPLIDDDVSLATYGQQDQTCGAGIDCCSQVRDDDGLRFRLTEFNIYPTFSYLRDQSATYNEFEFASHTNLGFLEMENRTVMNVADLPSTIKLGPTNPGDLPSTVGVRGNGFGDILSGFFFSLPGAHEQKTHLGVGPVLTFPTASNAILGSEQYTAGPGVHFSTEIDRLTAGFFLWQSWGFGEATGQKKINQLFGKPFLIYEMTEKWNLVYIPLGMSHSWESPSGDDWTVPLGGGVRRLFEINGQKMGFQFQAFDYVARKSKDPEWELRSTIEFLFD